MLDRDHALTELGIEQAEALNQRWKEFEESRHAEAPKSTKKSVAFAEKASPKNQATANLLDGYDDAEQLPDPVLQKTGSSSFPDTQSVFDFMNDDFPAPPPPAQNDVSSLKSPLQSKSDEMWDETDLTESLWRFNEAIDFGDAEGGADIGDNGGNEEDDDDDDRFEQKLNRLSLSRNFGKGNRQLDLLQIAENIDESNEEVTENNDNNNNNNNSNTGAEKVKNRLSASADELLRDLHNSKLQLQGLDHNIEKRKKEYMRLFLHADRIYSSPLTRALETAVVSMEGHKALQTSGITLYR